MNTLIFDTETTGLTNSHRSQTHPDQPMPIQLGMKVDDKDRNERLAVNLLIRPDGWSMNEGAKQATGLSDELATEFGTELITAYELFLDCISMSNIVVAHNIAFDLTVMRRAGFVYSEIVGQTYQDPFENKILICTMHPCTNIVKAMPFKRNAYKWPKLSECIWYFWQEEIDGAHDALVDVRACARLYYHLVDNGVLK